MAYQVLARKWRPQDFSSVVGQQPIVTALRNALTEGRIAQAYLFSGIRGVGKTSVARILAKALNCEKGPAADPCNECVPCREITDSADLDVHEVDAATHSKVEQVRDLTEGLKYSPARDRYKVIIIDEIHRLSRQAFDALLKIVEEPPPHLVFIFATTEAEAVPVTILSRCQEFRFRRVPSRVLTEHLRRIADAEELSVGDKALRLIARGGDGSVRDSVALLDQLATFGSGTISDEDAARVLGGLDGAVFERLLAAMVGGDAAGVAEIVADVAGLGWDPRHAYGEFLTYCRDALHLALGGGSAEVDLPEEESARLAALAREAGYENLLRLLHLLLESENTVRRSEAGLLALEVCWLRAAELPKLVRVEELLGGRLPGDSGGAAPSDGGGSRTGDDEPRLFDARRTKREAPQPAPAARRRSTDPSPPPDGAPREDPAPPAAEATPPTAARAEPQPPSP
ncbi:MAG: DNA polymerase III subunit gamma/tau, partial [Thermoanaerobaculia bacterium]|nr:DNA polymerase III subunit gamma/tau [Thermoanaerobaculia bacterium]